jgi:hypothetical protein
MLIVDSQIHIWENARMSGQHRQTATYSKDDALAEMREGGVDVSSQSDSNAKHRRG